ncbi:hypothetical protein [Deinococcus wulumuqiensis]|uniref:hypothetical protein n=1 Tax=Deinococcus wulumuqiensis TaxID=980427 RepID=UPI0013C2E66A|nr:hypothetical protein [Deinococcus wulumuqiensis]
MELTPSTVWKFVELRLEVCGIFRKNAVPDNKRAAPLMMHHFFFIYLKKYASTRQKADLKAVTSSALTTDIWVDFSYGQAKRDEPEAGT